MKFSSLISLIVFTTSMAWTWDIIHETETIPFETHAGIQEKLASFIVETIKSKRPTASEVSVDKIWTEPINNGRVRAHFTYSFKDAAEGETFSSQIQGQADLERGGQDGDDSEHWVLLKIKTTSDAIVFDEGLTISPDSNERN